MFKVGDVVWVDIDASDQSVDYNSKLKGEKFTVDGVEDNGYGVFYRLMEASWWVSREALTPDGPTQEKIIARKIAMMYQRFDLKQARK
jgi:hypothetical protein